MTARASKRAKKKPNISEEMGVLMLLDYVCRDVPVTLLQSYRSSEHPDGYQRDPEARWLNKHAGKYCPILVGRILVAQRADKSYWIVDGQQRTELARMSGIDKVPCHVFQSDGPVMEATIFALQDEREKLNCTELFQARLVSGDMESEEIVQIVARSGLNLQIEKSTTGIPMWGRLNCLRAVQQTQKRYKNLDETLRFITTVWNGQADAMRAEVVSGLSTFLHYYKDQYDPNDLHRKLGESTCLTVIRQAHQILADFRGGGSGRSSAFVQALVDTYNKKKRQGKLLSFAQMKREVGVRV